MPLLYHWIGKNYRRDLDLGAGFYLNQSNKLLHEIGLGDSLWAFTRTPDFRYVLVAELVVRAKTLNLLDHPYGPYRVWGDLERSRYFSAAFQTDISDLIRQLSVKANAQVIGQSFQGHAAVRPLTMSDHEVLVDFARNLDLEPRARLLPEEELETLLLHGKPELISNLIESNTPGIATGRQDYLVRQSCRRSRKHVDNLRELYGGACQLCRWNPKAIYRENLCEAHHVHWLSRGGDDALYNMVLICPNHHRAIHRTDAPFDWSDKSFVFPGKREPIQVSYHGLTTC